LQHERRQKTEAAYQREDRLEQRRPVMERWATFLESKLARQRKLESHLSAPAELTSARTVRDVEDWLRAEEADREEAREEARTVRVAEEWLKAKEEDREERVSDLLCMSNLAHASKLKEHDDNDDIQGSIRRAAERR
jgi:hypothetical protein